MASGVDDDVKLLDDLTRLKLRLLDRKLQPSARATGRRRPRTPETPITPPLPPERRRTRFNRKIDRRNEILQKLWEELGNGGTQNHYARSLPPLSAIPLSRADPPLAPWLDEHYWNKTGNTKKDLMELMLIQNAQMQQWLMTQTLQRNQRNDDGNHHHHYYGPNGRILPPIQRSDAGSQYPQDFFREDTQQSIGFQPQQLNQGTIVAGQGTQTQQQQQQQQQLQQQQQQNQQNGSKRNRRGRR